MRIIILIFSLMIAITFGVIGINQNKVAQDNKVKIKDIEHNISLIIEEQKKVNSLPVREATNLNTVYKDFHNYVKIIAEYYKINADVSIVGYKDTQNIEKYFGNSELQGVKKLNLKITFSKISELMNYVSLLSDLNELKDKVSFEFLSINLKSKNLELIVNLYGV